MKETNLLTGECRFCGNPQEVIAEDKADADYIVTKDCNCEKSQRAAEYDMMMANLNAILDGDECIRHKFIPVDERTKSLITEVADLIFEKKIDKATFVTAASTVKLVVTDKAAKVSRERIEKICFE